MAAGLSAGLRGMGVASCRGRCWEASGYGKSAILVNQGGALALRRMRVERKWWAVT
jgi:hypothetical protein